MTAFIWRGRILSALCTLFLLLVAASCQGGSTTVEHLPGTAPSIFGLSKSDVNSGDALSIFGSNFGLEQGSGQATLNGTPLTIVKWDDTQIDVTVPAGASSGVIIVSQDGQFSESARRRSFTLALRLR